MVVQFYITRFLYEIYEFRENVNSNVAYCLKSISTEFPYCTITYHPGTCFNIPLTCFAGFIPISIKINKKLMFILNFG